MAVKQKSSGRFLAAKALRETRCSDCGCHQPLATITIAGKVYCLICKP